MQTKKARRFGAACILLLALGVMLRSLFVGLEIDEEYALSLGFRLLTGDRLFSTMWEPHQLSALTPVPLLALYRAVTGGTTGVLLFVRAVMLAAKAALAYGAWRLLRKPLGSAAFWWAVVLFLYTPKWFLGPDYISQQFHYTLAAFLCFAAYYAPGPRQHARPAWLVAGAVCSCLSFLAFPQSIAAAPVYAVGMAVLGAKGGEARLWRIPRGAVWYFGSCCVCGLAFVAWVLPGLGPVGLVQRALLILSDPQYNFTTAQRMAQLAAQAWDVAKFLARPALLALAATALWQWRQPAAPARVVERALWLFAAAVLAFCSVYALRGSSLDLRHFCPVVTLAGGVTFWLDRREEQHAALRRVLFWLGWLPGVAAYAVILRSTLLGLAPTFMYLSWPALCGVAALALRGGQEKDTAPRRMATAILLLWTLFLAVCRLFLVQTTGWKPHDIFDTPLKQITAGPACGIWADETAADMQQALVLALEPYAGQQVAQAIGEVHGLGFLAADGTLRVGQASVISGTDSDPRFEQYYEEMPEKLPAVILYDDHEVRDLQAYHAWLEEHLAIAERYGVQYGTASLQVLVVDGWR